ncbi:polyprenyl synthetase family protein [Streptomyces sp. NPDC001514]
MRPQLCVAGWYAGGGQGDSSAVLSVAAALEWFQAFALIHDDIMDVSDLRRGQPTAHRALAAAYTSGGGRHGRAEAHGMNATILLGDVTLAWSDDLLHGADLDTEALTRILPLVDTMRNELVYGQYLDLVSTDRLSDDVEAALRVVHYKTAKYTMEWPLRIGAVAPAPHRTSWTRAAPSHCRWAKRFSCATTSSACSATPPRPAIRSGTTYARERPPC